jgi:putative transposase
LPAKVRQRPQGIRWVRMWGEGDQAGATGAEAARRAAVLRPLVQAYLTGSGRLESGIRDALWELGVSRATVWRWIRRLAAEGGRTRALVPQKRGRRADGGEISYLKARNDVQRIVSQI